MVSLIGTKVKSDTSKLIIIYCGLALREPNVCPKSVEFFMWYGEQPVWDPSRPATSSAKLLVGAPIGVHNRPQGSSLLMDLQQHAVSRGWNKTACQWELRSTLPYPSCFLYNLKFLARKLLDLQPAFMLVSCLSYLTLKMEALCSSETLTEFQWTTQQYTPHDSILQCNPPTLMKIKSITNCNMFFSFICTLIHNIAGVRMRGIQNKKNLTSQKLIVITHIRFMLLERKTESFFHTLLTCMSCDVSATMLYITWTEVDWLLGLLGRQI
jgi:hypothetical protein